MKALVSGNSMTAGALESLITYLIKASNKDPFPIRVIPASSHFPRRQIRHSLVDADRVFQIDLIGEALREETMKGGAVVHLIDNGFLVVPPGFKKIPR